MHKISPPIWEALARASKHQQLLVLQQAFDRTAEEMGLRAPTIATPSLLKLVLALRFRMESRDDLTTGIHPFVLGQHLTTVRKFLRGQADWYEGAPVPEATMTYRSACPRRNLRTVAVCWPRTKGWSPGVQYEE